MASGPAFSALKLSLGITVPLLIDLTYQEAYLVPFTTPNLYAESGWKELSKPKGIPFGIPPSLTFNRYRTENPWHVQYVHAKKSFWRYNAMWPFLGVVTTALQLNYLINSLRVRWATGAIAAVSAMGLTWTATLVEGNARRMYLDKMQEKVLKEEETLTG